MNKKTNKKDITYKTTDLCTIEEVQYSDGTTLYNLHGKNEVGTWIDGLYNQVEVLIQVLVAMGKISEPKTYVFKSRD